MTDNVYAPPRANLETQEGPPELWQVQFKRLARLYSATQTIRALGFLYALVTFFLALGVMAALRPDGGSTPGATIAILILSSALSLAGTVGSFARPLWGRWAGIALCVVGLAGFPVGTLVGLFGIVAYAQGARLFGPDRLKHEDVIDVYKRRKRTKT